MPELYLIRHGIATERDETTKDEERPLTDKGRQKTEKVAERLDDLGVRFQLILTSPLVRARQTAEILQKAKLSPTVEEMPDLAPEGKLENWVNWWSQWSYNKEEISLALVGHQPDLGNWSEILIWGEKRDKLIVKKAGIIGLLLPINQTPVSHCELFLLSSPKWLLEKG